MGDIFCLIILESGSRRKLKLREGTYNELLARLRGIADVELDNTLIQVFDSDLEDFVDLLPDDTVENKAKLRIIQKNTPKRASNGVCANGFVTPYDTPHNGWVASPVQHPALSWPGRQSAGTTPQTPSFAAGSVPCQQQRAAPRSEEANSATESALMCDVIKVDLTDDSCFENGESICRIGEVFSQVFPNELEDNTDHQPAEPLEPPEKRVANGDINGEKSASESQQSEASARPDAEGSDKVSEDPVMRLSQVQEMLEMLPPIRHPSKAAKSAVVSKEQRAETLERMLALPRSGEVADLALRPEDLHFGRDRSDYLKFTLPKSFGCVCDTALERKFPVSKRIKQMIIGGLFSQCIKITMYPSRRMYRKAIETLVTAYPHVIKGRFDWDDWVRGLRYKFKNVRRRLPEDVVPDKYHRPKLGPRPKPSQQAADDSEQSDPSDNSNHTSSAKEASSTTVPEQRVAEDAAEARPSSPTGSFGLEGDVPQEEEVVNGLPSSATPVKEVTVFELLDRCMREPVTPKKLFTSSNLEWHDDEDNAGTQPRPNSEEKTSSPCRTEASTSCRTDVNTKQLHDLDDYLQFQLPSLGIYTDSVAEKAVLTGRMRRYIVNRLFEACYKITMYPSSNLYRTAVESLIEKYPHLRDTTGETGREKWNESLRAKFKNIRRKLPGHMWDPEAAETPPGDKPSAKRLKPDETCKSPDDVKRVFRPAKKDVTKGYRDRAASAQLSPDEVSGMLELTEAQARHDAMMKMSITVAILAFPSFKQEPSLLAEFRTLWRRDIAECFEKGIKRMCLVLMKSPSTEEIAAFSRAGSDILMVVLTATAARLGEKMDSLLTENTALATTPCLVVRADGSLELFVAGYFLFTASSLLGGVCALFAAFWVFHIEYPRNARNILAFLEHAFLDLRQTKPHIRCFELINLYRGSRV